MFNNKRNQINPRRCTLKFPGDKFLSQYDRFGVSIIKDKVPYFYVLFGNTSRTFTAYVRFIYDR